MTDTSAPLPSEGDYGASPPPADEPPGPPVDFDNGQPAAPSDDGSIYGHSEEVTEPTPGRQDARAPVPAAGHTGAGWRWRTRSSDVEPVSTPSGRSGANCRTVSASPGLGAAPCSSPTARSIRFHTA